MPPTRLEIRRRTDPDGQLLLVLAGEIDLSTVDTLAEALAAAPPTARHVRVDRAEVTFPDSTGISALIAARRRAFATGKTLTVVHARDMVRRVLDVTGPLPTLTDHDRSSSDGVRAGPDESS